MKTRIIRTDIFCDEIMLQLETQSRMIAVYLYCNKHIGLTNLYKLPVGYIQIETGYDISSIKISLDKLQDVGIIKHKEYYWIELLKRDFASLSYAGGKNDIAIRRYLSEIPEDVKLYFNIDGTIDSTLIVPPMVPINNKSEIRNHKSEIDVTNKVQETRVGPPLDLIRNSWSDFFGYSHEKNSFSESENSFILFWESYPVKKSKRPAYTKWNYIKKSLYPIIMEDIEKRKKEEQTWLSGYVPIPTTYLNQERWNDEITRNKPGGIIKKYDKRDPSRYQTKKPIIINNDK